MARKKREPDGQLPLIDVDPDNIKVIKRAARAYRKAHEAQLAAKTIADGKMDALMDHVKEAKLPPLPDGTITFTIDGMIVKVGKPKSRVTVRDAQEEPEPEEPDANVKFEGTESEE